MTTAKKAVLPSLNSCERQFICNPKGFDRAHMQSFTSLEQPRPSWGAILSLPPKKTPFNCRQSSKHRSFHRRAHSMAGWHRTERCQNQALHLALLQSLNLTRTNEVIWPKPKSFQAQKGPAFLSCSLQGYLNGCTALSPLINKSVLGQAKKSCEHA